MGLGRKSLPLAAKVQNLMIEDFLNYLAAVMGVFPSWWDEDVKKKRGTRP